MELLADFARLVVELLLVLLAIAVFYQLLTGHISLRGIFRDKTGKEELSPARIQLFVIGALGALQSLRGAAESAASETPELSLLPVELLGLLAASQGFYLIDKYRSHRHKEEQNA